jgi:hypothetical protein
MAKNYVFSTLANDQRYTNWLKGGADMPVKGHSVLIQGGTGVANDRFITPLGVATEVSDLDLEELEKNQVFTKHKADGFITIRTKKADAEKVASDMNMKDKSAPLTPASFTEEDQPKVGA